MQVKLRGESMQAAADAAESSMVSVIGLDSGKVQEICDAVNERVGAGSVQIANFLCPGNYVISGSSEVRSTQHTLPCQAVVGISWGRVTAVIGARLSPWAPARLLGAWLLAPCRTCSIWCMLKLHAAAPAARCARCTALPVHFCRVKGPVVP